GWATSRMYHCVKTVSNGTMPRAVMDACEKKKSKCPVQLGPVPVPPAPCAGVRTIVGPTHKVALKKGAASLTFDQRSNPVEFLRARSHVTWKSSRPAKSGVPSDEAAGTHPSEFALPTQYSCTPHSKGKAPMSTRD